MREGLSCWEGTLRCCPPFGCSFLVKDPIIAWSCFRGFSALMINANAANTITTSKNWCVLFIMVHLSSFTMVWGTEKKAGLNLLKD